MKKPAHQTCLEVEEFKAIHEPSLHLPQILPDAGACMKPECRCCRFWTRVLGDTIGLTGKILEAAAAEVAGRPGANCKEIEDLQALVSSLTEDNKRYAKANRELNAKANRINIPTVTKKKAGPRKAGRPKGQKPTINCRPKRVDRVEEIDCKECPDCGNDNLSDVTDRYDRIVTVMRVMLENVRYVIKRRWCRGCKKQVSGRVPGAAKHARRSSNFDAAMTSLNMNGLSHARAAEFGSDAWGHKISRPSAYRGKIRQAERMAPERDSVRKRVLEAPHLNADEFHWPLGGKRGYGIVALAKDACLVKVTDSRGIKTLCHTLPDYKGTITQDSYSGWLHVGSCRQMCVWHQERLVQKDVLTNPKGDVPKFLDRLSAIHDKIYRASRIKDGHTRIVAAHCIDAELRGLMNEPFADDGHGTIARHKKRNPREGYFMTTCLHVDGIEPDNNAVERVNRRFVAIRSDGGGNRSQKGMDANSILFTLLATDRINANSFFDHLVRSSSGDS